MLRYFLSTLLLLCAVPSSVHADLLYAVDATNLILVNRNNPVQSVVIGPHSLGNDYIPFSMAYSPAQDALVGVIGYSSFPYYRHLVRFDPFTGQGTVLADLGGIDGAGLHEGIEYADLLSSLVIGKSPADSAFAPDLLTIDLSGSTAELVSTTPAIDNDQLGYDSIRHRMYSIDSAGGSSYLSQVDLVSGQTTVVGSIPSTIADDLAFSAEEDTLYMLASGTLYRSDPESISFVSVGTVPGTNVRGLAFVSSVPEPGSACILGALAAFALLRIRHWR